MNDLLPVLKRVAPDTSPLVGACLQDIRLVLDKYLINTPLRVCHFLAQILEETGGFTSTTLVENLNYSAANLHTTWPNRFPTLQSAASWGCVPHEPSAIRQAKIKNIAFLIYGGRMGNVNASDALAFCGHGLIQITGRSMYALLGLKLSLDLVNHPELSCDPAHALEIAAYLWTYVKNCNTLADANDIKGITHAINGGYINLEARIGWYNTLKGYIN